MINFQHRMIELKKEIEQLREQLYRTAEIHGMRSEHSIRASQALDKKIVEYQRLDQEKNRK